MTVRPKTALFLSFGMAPVLALAQVAATDTPELELRIERCSVLGDASARLACYDGLARKTPGGQVAAAPATGGPATEAEKVAAADAPARTQPDAPPPPPEAVLPPTTASAATRW